MFSSHIAALVGFVVEEEKQNSSTVLLTNMENQLLNCFLHSYVIKDTNTNGTMMPRNCAAGYGYGLIQITTVSNH